MKALKKLSLIQQLLLVLGLFFSIIIIVQLFLDTEQWLEEAIPQKKIEITSSEIVGYEDGTKSFVVRSGYIWSTGNKYVFFIDHLDSGSLYNSKGEIVLDKIEAKGVRINSRRNIILATQNVTAEFIRNRDDEELSPIHVVSKELKYFGYNKTSALSGDVVLTYDESIITADKVHFDHNENVVTLEKPFKIEAEDYTVSSNAMTIDLDADQAVLENDVVVFRPAMDGPFPVTMDAREVTFRSTDSKLSVDRLTYHERKTDDTRVTFEGNLLITQKDKSMSGDYGAYYKESEVFVVSGNVSFEGDSLDFFIKESHRDSFLNPDVQSAMLEPFHITCEYMRFDMDTNFFEFSGDVLIVQKDKRIQADRVEFNDAKNSITLLGQVVIEHNKDVFKGESLVLDLDREAFWTNGPASIDFYLEDDKPSS